MSRPISSFRVSCGCRKSLAEIQELRLSNFKTEAMLPPIRFSPKVTHKRRTKATDSTEWRKVPFSDNCYIVDSICRNYIIYMQPFLKIYALKLISTLKQPGLLSGEFQ